MPQRPKSLDELRYGRPVSLPDMAAALGIDRRTLARHVQAGELAYILIGCRRRFLREDAEAFLERQRRREIAPTNGEAPTRRVTGTQLSTESYSFTAHLEEKRRRRKR